MGFFKKGILFINFACDTISCTMFVAFSPNVFISGKTSKRNYAFQLVLLSIFEALLLIQYIFGTAIRPTSVGTKYHNLLVA